MSGLDNDRPGSGAIEGDARRTGGRLEFFRDGEWRPLDDFSCDPRRWSWKKLGDERRNGMPAVLAEIERRHSAG